MLSGAASVHRWADSGVLGLVSASGTSALEMGRRALRFLLLLGWQALASAMQAGTCLEVVSASCGSECSAAFAGELHGREDQ